MEDLPPIEIAVFWDYENTPLPREVRPAEAAKSIQAAAESLPSVAGRRCRINMRRVYYDPDKYRGVPRDPSGLDSSGFDLVSTPTRNMKGTVDKKLIVDLLTFAWEVRERGGQPCVVLITSDGDYSYTLAKLRDKGVMNVVMYGKDKNTANTLKDNAMDSLSFEKDVLASSVPAPTALSSTRTTKGAATSTQTISQIRYQSAPLPPSSSNENLHQRDTEMLSESAYRYVFLCKLPRGIEAREVFSFLSGTYGIDVRHVSIEILEKVPTGQTRFAHVQCTAKHADYLIALSTQNGLLYKEKTITAIDDSKPPTSDELRRLPSDLVYSGESSSEESGSKRRHLSPKKSSSSIGEADRNILALCVCLATKQKTWSSHVRSKGLSVGDENCWVPSDIVISAYKQPDGGVSDVFSTIRDDAIELDFVETARHKLKDKDSFVPIKLDVPTKNLSKEYYLRLTPAGQECVAELQDSEVLSLCSALYQKQEDMFTRFGLKFESVWIAPNVLGGAYQPTYPLAQELGVASQYRETREIAITSRYIEKARKMIGSKNEFVTESSWRSYDLGALSDDLYYQLTAAGKDLVESTSTAGTNNRRVEQREKRQKTSDALLFGLSAPR